MMQTAFFAPQWKAHSVAWPQALAPGRVAAVPFRHEGIAMPEPHPPAQPHPRSDDELLDEALDETFPASDPVQFPHQEDLPPADAPGSDVHDK